MISTLSILLLIELFIPCTSKVFESIWFILIQCKIKQSRNKLCKMKKINKFNIPNGLKYDRYIYK